ncbi:MAG: hypothetical protein ISR48_01245 [Alphaproteobacteria bacterium]|nr:hypothetical protein [Alphaproteobacteria bacterium]
MDKKSNTLPLSFIVFIGTIIILFDISLESEFWERVVGVFLFLILAISWNCFWMSAVSGKGLMLIWKQVIGLHVVFVIPVCVATAVSLAIWQSDIDDLFLSLVNFGGYFLFFIFLRLPYFDLLYERHVLASRLFLSAMVYISSWLFGLMVFVSLVAV